MSRPVNSQIKRGANAIPRWPFTINRQSDQARGLTLWLPGGLGQGNDWLDLCAQNRATLTNGPLWTGGPLGTALLLDGSDDYAGLVDLTPINFQPTDSSSLVGWFRTTSNAAQTLMCSGNWGAGGTGGGYNLRVNADAPDTVDFAMLNNATSQIIFVTGTGAVSNDGMWHCAVSTYTGSNTAAGVSLYLDGRALSLTIGVDIAVTSLDNPRFRIGYNTNNFPQVMNGSIAEVRTYNRALSASEVWALYDPATRYELFQPVRRFAGKTASAPLGARRGDFNISLGAV